MWEYNSCLIHGDRTDHKYIEKHQSKSGNWVYRYAEKVKKKVTGESKVEEDIQKLKRKKMITYRKAMVENTLGSNDTASKHVEAAVAEMRANGSIGAYEEVVVKSSNVYDPDTDSFINTSRIYGVESSNSYGEVHTKLTDTEVSNNNTLAAIQRASRKAKKSMIGANTEQANEVLGWARGMVDKNEKLVIVKQVEYDKKKGKKVNHYSVYNSKRKKILDAIKPNDDTEKQRAASQTR